MKSLNNIDIILILLILLSVICILISPLNTASTLLIILLSYSLITALYPFKKDLGFKKRILASLLISLLVFSSIGFYTSFNIPYLILIILTVSTVLLALITFIRRKIRTSDRYLNCKKCNGHYKLNKGETLEDFESCTCGGELEYASHRSVKKKKKGPMKFQFPDVLLFIFSLPTSTVALISIAFLRRFKTPKKQKKFEVKGSKKEKKGSKSTYLDLILIFLITIFSIISVITPVLNESFIRTILGLLFILLLPGYSLIAALFPKMEGLDGIERAALSFWFKYCCCPLDWFGLKLHSFWN